MKELRDRVAVVTGAGSGIGRALAERFAAEGMRVVVADVDEARARETEALLAARGAQALAVQVDVRQPAAVEALAARTLEAFGAVHVLCNNAGIAGLARPTWEQSLEEWAQVVDVNLWGVIHGIRTFVPIMLRQGTEGHVVNTASMAGLMSLPLIAPYHATKFAVVTVSESLHMELGMTGAPVRVSVLCPGFVRTNIGQDSLTSPRSEAEAAMHEAFRRLIAEGLDPAVVAERVVEAIRDERFWVFSHPELVAAVEQRAASIVAGRNPEATPLPI
jgi:NAD(P)-dependent dehydrogenase (short-subunit alcohol dehydrogenase family)